MMRDQSRAGADTSAMANNGQAPVTRLLIQPPELENSLVILRKQCDHLELSLSLVKKATQPSR